MASLDLGQDLGFERRTWRVQRFAWIAGALVLVAAALGVFGRGPISRAVVHASDDAVTLHFERLARRHAPTELKIELAPWASAGGDGVSIWFERSCLEQGSFERVTPEPDSVQLLSDRVVFTFKIAPGAAGPPTIAIRQMVEETGSLICRLGILHSRTESGGELVMKRFVYP